MNWMMKNNSLLAMIFVMTVLIELASAVQAQDASASKPGIRNPCLICHGKKDFKKVKEDGSVKKLYVNEEELAQSMHAEKRCIDCHSDVTLLPHAKKPNRVTCSH